MILNTPTSAPSGGQILNEKRKRYIGSVRRDSVTTDTPVRDDESIATLSLEDTITKCLAIEVEAVTSCALTSQESAAEGANPQDTDLGLKYTFDEILGIIHDYHTYNLTWKISILPLTAWKSRRHPSSLDESTTTTNTSKSFDDRIFEEMEAE